MRRMALALVLSQMLAVLTPIAVPPALAATIVSRGPATSAVYAPASTTTVRVTAPASAQAGDVLIASIGVGKAGATAQPTITAPTG